jgi:hypothetical protein
VEECTYFWGVNTSWGINTAESKRPLNQEDNQAPQPTTNTGQPNILRWLTYGFFLVNISSRFLNPSALWDNMFWTYNIVLVASSHKCIGRS